MTNPQLWTDFYYMIGVLFRGTLTLVLVVTFCAFPREFIPVERWGWGIAAGGAFMTLPVLWNTPVATPFDGWAGTLFAAGVLIAACARLFRGFRHWWGNNLKNPGWKQ